MITVVINDGNKCKLTGDELPTQLLRKLDEELSFSVPGAEYTYYYKVKGWDGKKRLMNNKLEFAYGLLDRVLNFFNRFDVDYQISDVRKKSSNKPIDISSNLSKMNKSARDYQIAAADKVYEKDIGIFRLATGAGKSLLAGLMIANLGKSANLYVIGKDLLYQFYDFFSKVFDEEIGIIGDGKCEIRRINIVSIWTVSQAFDIKMQLDEEFGTELSVDKDKYDDIKEMLTKIKVHIFDECHACACDSVQIIADNIKPEHIYGMSASPWRDDNSDLLIECILGHKIVNISASDLIEKNYLVKPIIKFEKVPKYKAKLARNYQTVYKSYVVENEIRNDLIVKSTEKLVNLGYKTLVLFNSIKHGQILHELISQNVPCVLLSGKDNMEKRNQAKEDIETGKIKVILASRIFDVGVDLPCLSGLVLAGGGKSSVRALQRIGRVIRPYTNKKNAAIIDFYDDTHYLKEHSKERKNIYESEPGFVVKWVE